MFRFVLICTLCMVSQVTAADEKFVPNYDESKVPEFDLPQPLVTTSGDTVANADQWTNLRRGELFELFQREVYGRAPEKVSIRHQLISVKSDAIGGKATRREVDVFFGTESDAPAMRLLIYVPNAADTPVPAFLGLNFIGNHSMESDPEISITKNWVRNRKGLSNGNRASESARGAAMPRWPIEMIVDRGYALVTIYYGDIDPDFDDGFKNGIHRTLQQKVQTIPANERWGSIATWAYGLSHALDFLMQDDAVDGKRVAVIGHSRLGKTALWAGATDPRFALVISNNSGCGGAALSRRGFGETVGRINRVFPHWFCDNYWQYNENEHTCPVDQHELVALIAPRPVYIASASEDLWADPKGEFLSAYYADQVYRLLGTDGFGGTTPPTEMPPVDSPLASGTIGYHVRAGKHDLTKYDWQQYLDFADRHLRTR